VLILLKDDGILTTAGGESKKYFEFELAIFEEGINLMIFVVISKD
jgi:hypothetical protein